MQNTTIPLNSPNDSAAHDKLSEIRRELSIGRDDDVLEAVKTLQADNALLSAALNDARGSLEDAKDESPLDVLKGRDDVSDDDADGVDESLIYDTMYEPDLDSEPAAHDGEDGSDVDDSDIYDTTC